MHSLLAVFTGLLLIGVRVPSASFPLRINILLKQEEEEEEEEEGEESGVRSLTVCQEGMLNVALQPSRWRFFLVFFQLKFSIKR